MTESKHTPLPWAKSYGNDVGPNDEGFWEWYQVGPAQIPLSTQAEQRVEDEANADFVFCAVNSHESLVKALEALLEAVAGEQRDPEELRKSLGPYAPAAIKQAEAALTAAGKENKWKPLNS